MKPQHIDHVAITVRDVARSVAWYRDVLGLERRHEDVWGDVPSMMCAGDTCVAIFAAAADSPKPPPGADTIAMRHFALRVDGANMAAARGTFAARGIAIREEDHTIARSIYIQDPDGHTIEITTYDL